MGLKSQDERQASRALGAHVCVMSMLCYVDVMSIRRITLSVQEEVAQRIKKAAGSTPVSSWVAEVIAAHIDEEALEREFESFCEAHQPSSAEKRRVDAMMSRLRPNARKRSA